MTSPPDFLWEEYSSAVPDWQTKPAATPAILDVRAFSSEVDTGSREEKRVKTKKIESYRF
jgi:hypothetical protein